jgi:NAD-dependent deacetylase
MSEVPAEILALARGARRVTVLTGAGMSAESGVPTFRDAQTGLWARHDPESLAPPEAWERDASLVWAWYLWRVSLLRTVGPNAGHLALARWARRADLRLVTQNVDDLHERAGSQVLAHLHGSLLEFRCSRCDTPYGRTVELPETAVERLTPPTCPRCQGPVRPGVVWFRESLPQAPYDAAAQAVRDADLVLVVGTSGMVYPAAMLPSMALRAGIPVVEVNPNTSELTAEADHVWTSTAAVALPALVDAL